MSVYFYQKFKYFEAFTLYKKLFISGHTLFIIHFVYFFMLLTYIFQFYFITID